MSKYKDLVTKNKINTIERIEYRIQNRDMIKESQNIAIKVLMKLAELGLMADSGADDYGCFRSLEDQEKYS